ncbi:hypothetical protein NMG60_11017461 [Bertholletia excelsa]
MGNGYNHHHHLHQNLQYRSTGFLPMLCSRPSIKDVHIPKSSSAVDPSSPRVGCMGEVKRTNRVIGFPPPYRFATTKTTATATATHVNVKYHKLKRLFSARNLPAVPPTTVATTTISSSRRSSEMINVRSVPAAVKIEEMDPPLPVVKRVQPAAEVSLWKRRSGGPSIQSLQLQHIHQLPHNSNNSLSINNLQPISTV